MLALSRRHQDAPPLTIYGGWSGRRAALTGITVAMFVGERLGPTVDPTWPPLYGGFSGMYIWRAIAIAGYHVGDMYFTNALKQLGQRDDLREEARQAAPRRVIALGQIASNKLFEQEISHWALPHPSYWRRFHYRRFPEYVAALKEALA